LQEPTIDKKYVPSYEMWFQKAEEALDFWKAYAHLAGFPVRKNRKRNGDRTQEVECSFAGAYTKGPGDDRVREKTTKTKKCKAMVSISRATDGTERYNC
jgi:hypothetical protein